MDHCYIVGIRVNHRVTKYVCNIKLRVGLHETNENYCSDDGIIMLQVCGEKDKLEGMVSALDALDGIRAKMLDLD